MKNMFDKIKKYIYYLWFRVYFYERFSMWFIVALYMFLFFLMTITPLLTDEDIKQMEEEEKKEEHRRRNTLDDIR